jgi:DNA polymerase-1
MTTFELLPHAEIWIIDFEFYPGSGLANGGVEGDLPTPLCLVALEMRSGRLVRLWQDELGRFPPYRLDADSVIISYALAAEAGCHLQLGWGQPANLIDALVEFRHASNDGAAEQREKNFYSLLGAVQYFGGDLVDAAHKKTMRECIMRGPPFTAAERAEILAYCTEDVRSLAWLVSRLVPTIRSLPHALLRAKYVWCLARQERRGVPIDLPLLRRLRKSWGAIKCHLVRERDHFGIYEIVDGVPHWRQQRFNEYLLRTGKTGYWSKLDSGAYATDDATFKTFEARDPDIHELRQVRYTLSKLKLNRLAVGGDGRNRTPLWAFATKTARNAPSNSAYVFGPAKWLRHLIMPPAGRALVARDYAQQEVRIAGLLAGDLELIAACESGDVYLGMAKQLGLAPASATAETHPHVRTLFKTVTLGIQYGLAAKSLALRTGLSRYEAAEILARLRARFRVFEHYAHSVADHAGIRLELFTQLGWYMKCPPGINPRTVRNFPIQSSAAEILHVATVLAERRGIELVASIHDAMIAECDVGDIEDVSVALDRAMRDAAAIILRGHELPTDDQIIQPDRRYFDKNGAAMWETVQQLLARAETA